jgi:hypothetical protein
MSKVLIEGYRFHDQKDLALYKNEGKEKGMFRFTKPLLQAECEDKTIKLLLEAMSQDNLKGTILKAYRKNVDGHWDFCMEGEGKQKGSWGGEQTAEAVARTAQDDEEETHIEKLRAVE